MAYHGDQWWENRRENATCRAVESALTAYYKEKPEDSTQPEHLKRALALLGSVRSTKLQGNWYFLTVGGGPKDMSPVATQSFFAACDRIAEQKWAIEGFHWPEFHGKNSDHPHWHALVHATKSFKHLQRDLRNSFQSSCGIAPNFIKVKTVNTTYGRSTRAAYMDKNVVVDSVWRLGNNLKPLQYIGETTKEVHDAWRDG